MRSSFSVDRISAAGLTKSGLISYEDDLVLAQDLYDMRKHILLYIYMICTYSRKPFALGVMVAETEWGGPLLLYSSTAVPVRNLGGGGKNVQHKRKPGRNTRPQSFYYCCCCCEFSSYDMLL